MNTPPNAPSHAVFPVPRQPGYPGDDPRYLASPAPSPAPADLCADLTQMALMGAVIGATGAAARHLRAMQQGLANAGQTVRETARAALITGAASAVAGAAAHAVTRNGLTRLAVLLTAGTAVMYAAHSRDSFHRGFHQDVEASDQ